MNLNINIVMITKNIEAVSFKIFNFISQYFNHYNFKIISEIFNLTLFQNFNSSSLLVDKIKKTIDKSNKIIFISPEYHGNISAILKNFFEYLPLRTLKNKICWPIITTGSQQGSSSIYQLILLINKLGGLSFPNYLILNNFKEKHFNIDVEDKKKIIKKGNLFLKLKIVQDEK